MGIKVALLSVTKDEYLAPQLAAFGLTGMFDRVMGLDDHYGRGKEALAERLIKELGVDARDVLFVGDTMHDFDVASSVGAQCTLINHGHQSKQRLLTKTERVVDTFAEIIL
jgi:phosphoglycolate phosphatase